MADTRKICTMSNFWFTLQVHWHTIFHLNWILNWWKYQTKTYL